MPCCKQFFFPDRFSWLYTGHRFLQKLLTLPEHPSSPPVFNGVRVTRSLVLHVFCRSLFVLFLLAIVLSVFLITSSKFNRVGGVMVSVLASSAVDGGFELRSRQTEDDKIGICCFSDEHATLWRKSRDWLARNQNNVSERGDMSIRRLLFQWVSIIKIQLGVLVKYKADLIIILSKLIWFSPWYSWKIAELALSNNQRYQIWFYLKCHFRLRRTCPQTIVQCM